jgi:hypothetical protein
MNGFQKVVLIAAIIILILALTFIGFAISYSQNQVWPPLIPGCPDYWDVDGSGNCLNTLNLGTCNLNGDPMSFNTSAYQGSEGLCAKYTWANKCGVTWDGITYGVNNPCATSSSSSSST